MTLESQASPPVSIRERFPRRIRRIFLGVVIPLVLLPILIIGGSVIVRARLLLIEQINAQLNANAQIMASEIEGWINAAQIRLDASVRQQTLSDNLGGLLSMGQHRDDSFAAIREAIFTELIEFNAKRGDVIFSEYFVIDANGNILIATEDEWEGRALTVGTAAIFTGDQANIYIEYAPEPFYEDQVMIFVHVPYQGADNLRGHVVGVLSHRQLLDTLEFGLQLQPLSRSYFITGGENFFQLDIAKKELQFFEPAISQSQTFIPLQTEYSYSQPQSNNFNTSLHSFNEIRSLASFIWLPKLGAGFVFEVPQIVAFQQFESLTPFMFYLLVFFVLSSILIAVLAANWLPRPIIKLTEITRQFARGNWDVRMPETRRDEIGLLAFTFNEMAKQLSDLYHTLRKQVEDQTLELQKRSSQFEATAKVARDIAALQDLNTILDNVTQLISAHFGFYHAGIFLLDEEKRFAVLLAANSPGGQRMLARGHRLAVGQTGVVGRVAETGEARIALDVGADRDYFDNPDLPETHSEMALPLIVQDEIIGVLDVQSKVVSAFTPEDTEVLQIMADQIALAIANARLHEESAQTIQELQTLYSTQLSESWRTLLGDQAKAYQFDRIRVRPATPEQYHGMGEPIFNHLQVVVSDNGDSILHLPIALRGQFLGKISLRRKHDEPDWSAEDILLAEEAIAQVSVALENARLLAESQRRAAQEELLSQTSARFNQSMDIETVLQMAVRELGQLAGVTEASVQLLPEE